MSTNSFVLKSVELENWKAFTNATLTISEEGVTGIVGSNGGGKSSFVDAILWCLFNHTPKDVTKAGLRRRKSDFSNDVTSVKVTFKYFGKTYEVYRQMVKKNSTTTGTIFIDGENALKESGRSVEAMVVSSIHMDVHGFKTAILVAQKELDSLVDLTASNRRASIEKLAGIEEMNVAIANARKQSNDLAKEVKVMPGSVEEVTDAQDALESVTEEREEVEGSMKLTLIDVTRAKENLDKQVSLHQEHGQKLHEANDANSRYQSLITNYKHNTSNIGQLKDTIQGIVESFSDVDPSKREEYRAQYKEVSAERNKLNEEYSQNQNAHNNLSYDLKNAQNRLSKAETGYNESVQAKEALNTLSKGVELPSNALELISEGEVSLDAYKSSEGRVQARINDMTDSINAMSKIGDKAHCPTCQNELKEPMKLVQKFKNIREESQEELVEIKRGITETYDNVQRLKSLHSEKLSLQSRIEEAEKSIERWDSELGEARTSVSALEEQLSLLPTIDEDEFKTKIEKFDEDLGKITYLGTRVNQAIEAETRRAELQTQLNSMVEENENLKSEGEILRKKLDSYGDLNELYSLVNEMNEQVSSLRETYNYLNQKQSNLNADYSRLQEREINAQKNLEREQKLITNKETSTKKLQKLTATAELLTEYREERIAKLAPELSITATDLISQMTNGRFIEVKISDDFGTEVVKDDGEVYGVAELSGGEKSIVALALRIAIGSLITNENSGLLWLDEVLPAQDKERRDAVLNVLKNLPIQQIVMINHTHEAEEVVNEVVRINYHEDGSTISYDKVQTLEEKLEEANII